MSDPNVEPYPETAKPRRRLLIVAVIAAVVVIAGVTTVAVLATRHRSAPAAAAASAGATPSRSPSPSPSASASPDRADFTFPARIGSLTRTTGPDSNGLVHGLTDLGVLHAFSEKYEDPGGRTILLSGGEVGESAFADYDAAQVLDDALKTAADPSQGRTAGARRAVAPGASGGTLACAPVTRVGTVCGWKKDNRYVEAILIGWQPDPGSALVRTVLDAIVLPG